MKTYQKVILAITLCVLGVAGLKWIKKKPDNAYQREEAPTKVEAVVARSGHIMRRVNAVGTLSALNSVKLHPQTNGKIIKVYAEEGKIVQEGDPLFKIDDAFPRAHVKEAEAVLALKKEEYKRAATLLEKKFGSAAARDKNLAEMQQAEAKLEEAKIALERTTLKAPFNGVLGLHEVSVGSYVSEPNPVATLVDLDPINVTFSLAESYLPFVQVGDNVDVTIEDFDILPVDAKILAISPEIDDTTRTFQLRAQLSNKEHSYRPGEFGRVTVTAGSVKDAVLVPHVSIERKGEDQYVFLVVDGIAVRTLVSTGMRDVNDVEITHGVKAGDLVVNVGGFSVRDGDEVTVVASNPTPEKVDKK